MHTIPVPNACIISLLSDAVLTTYRGHDRVKFNAKFNLVFSMQREEERPSVEREESSGRMTAKKRQPRVSQQPPAQDMEVEGEV